MSYGFQVVGPFGNVVVDDRHITLSVEETGFLPAPVPASIYNVNGGPKQEDAVFGVRVAVTFRQPVRSASPPLIAFVPRGGIGTFHALQVLGSPGAWTGFEVGYQQMPFGAQSVSNVPAPTMANLSWIYAVANPESCKPSDDTYGLRVWTADGRLAFDSGTPIVRILARVTGWQLARNIYDGSVRRYVAPWEFSGLSGAGFLASTMPMQQVDTAAGAWVSPRIGFHSAYPTQINLDISGATWDCHNILYRNIDSFDFDAVSRYVSGNRGFVVYAVQVMGI